MLLQESHYVMRWTDAMSVSLLQALSGAPRHGLRRVPSSRERGASYVARHQVVAQQEISSMRFASHPTPRSKSSSDIRSPSISLVVPRASPQARVTLSPRDFKLLRRLGSGQFAAVYLAVHKESGNPFAVKVRLAITWFELEPHDKGLLLPSCRFLTSRLPSVAAFRLNSRRFLLLRVILFS